MAGVLAEPLARGETGHDGAGCSGTPQRELTPRSSPPGLVAAIPGGLCSDVEQERITAQGGGFAAVSVRSSMTTEPVTVLRC